MWAAACRATVESSSTGGTASSTSSSGECLPPCCDLVHGISVCGGPNNCPVDGCWAIGLACGSVVNHGPSPVGPLGPCVSQSDAESEHSGDHDCPDGNILAESPGFSAGADPALGLEWCLPFDYGSLFCSNGGTSLLRYTDHSSGFDCSTPLPNPPTCPTVSGFQLCGPACGACSPGSVCTGRSPLHPFGLCLPNPYKPCLPGNHMNCNNAQVCLSFKVDAQDQAVADHFGVCVDKIACAAMAAGYPGGVVCNP
jgi:hypothetical protein